MAILKPCPFCGGRAAIHDHRLLWSVECVVCGALVLGDKAPEPEDDDEFTDGYWNSIMKTAVDRWNRRV